MKTERQNMNMKPLILIPILIIGLGLLPRAWAVIPAPDGGYPGGNTAEGQTALFSLTTGGFNTAIGWLSLRSNSIGSFNTAIGPGTLLANTADNNTATGTAALFSNTTGSSHTANGAFALFSNTSGVFNTAVGYRALYGNTTGHDNVALGHQAGTFLLSGSGNVYIGSDVNGNGGAESNRTYIRNIKDTTVSGGFADFVTVDLNTGVLGHASSSRRYKEDIHPMNNASEALYQLKPVTYRYKKEIDSTRSPAFGLIAEEVAEVNPDLVARNSQDQPESVHYEMVNAMLLNEFLKEHRKVEEQEASITRLKSTVAKQEATIAEQRKDFETTTAQQQKQLQALAATLNEQASQLQKVSAQLELNRPAPQQVALKIP
jgi:hypothetical protein